MDFLKPSSSFTAPHFLPREKSNETRYIRRLHSNFVEQRSYRGSGKPSNSGILQRNISQSEEERRDETNHRPITYELPHSYPYFQDGKLTNHQGKPVQGSMGSFHRLRGRLFPYSSPEKLPQIPPVHTQQSSLAVQGVTVRTISSPTHFHRHNGTSGISVSPERNQTAPLPRRLVDQSRFKGGGVTTCTVSNESYVRTRTKLKSKEKSIRTNSELCVPRVSIRSDKGYSKTNDRKRYKVSGQNENITLQKTRNSSRMAVNDRFGKCSCSSHTFRQNKCMPSGNTCSTILALDPEQSKYNENYHSCNLCSKRDPSCLDTTSSMGSNGIVGPIQGSTTPIHRRQYLRLGSSHGSPHSFRSVERSREIEPHQCSGMRSSSESSTPIPNGSSKSSCTRINRQFDHNVLHQSSGGHQIHTDVRDNQELTHVVSYPKYTPKSCTHQGLDERNGRSFIERQTHCKYRMEPSSIGDSESLETMVPTRYRPFCNHLQPQTGKICQPFSRQQRSSCGCPINDLGSLESVCFSTVCDTQKSYPETRTVSGMRNDYDHTILAKPTLVRNSPEPQSETANPTPTTIRPSETTSTSVVSPESRNTQPSRLESIQRQLNAEGLPKGVRDIMMKATRASTQKLYDKRWNSFVKWCISHNIIALEASVPNILEYLDYLRSVVELTPGTISGHKTAIIMTLENSVGRNLRDNTHIKLYIKGLMTLTTPRSTIPDWDLSLVLKILMKAPFEPLKRCSVKYLTFKTVFLVAFATAARRSELHALSKDFGRDVNWSYVNLKTVDGFIAKNQTTGCYAQSFRSFMIKSLTDFTNSVGLEDESLMCPVRALRIYTNRTLRSPDNKKLFVSFKEGHKGEIHPNTLSSWLKNTITLCYELSGKDSPAHVVAHSIRSMAVSWANLKNVGINQIMESCFWKSPNTFISYYLKDLTEIEGNMHKIGKVSFPAT